MSRRALASLLLGGCLVVLLVEAPSALREVRLGLRGPYEVRAAEGATPRSIERVASPAPGAATAPVGAIPRPVDPGESPLPLIASLPE